MADINEPVLQAAHHHSLDNRQLLTQGGQCGCFHCLRTFDATEVVHWGGKNSETGLCPYCHYDTILSGHVDPIDVGFLRRMQTRWFGGQKMPLDQSDEAKAAE